MSPGAHLLSSWIAGVQLLRERRERIIVAYAGLAPDLDGLGLVVDKIIKTTNYYFEYHHYLGHSLIAAFVIATLASLLARTQKRCVWIMSFFVFHLHVLCDIVGSRGPDGYQWPIYYLHPFSDWGATWNGQWMLHAWQNSLIMVTLMLFAFSYIVTKRISFFECFGSWLGRMTCEMYEVYILRKPRTDQELSS